VAMVQVSTSKQTAETATSTGVSQQGTTAQCHESNDASEHTNESVFAPELSTSVLVRGEVELYVLTSLQRTPVEQGRSAQTAGAASVHQIHQPLLKNSSQR